MNCSSDNTERNVANHESVNLRSAINMCDISSTSNDLNQQYHLRNENITSQNTAESHSTSLSFIAPRRTENSELTLDILGRSGGHGGGISSYYGEQLNDRNADPSFSSKECGTDRHQELGKSPVVPRIQVSSEYGDKLTTNDANILSKCEFSLSNKESWELKGQYPSRQQSDKVGSSEFAKYGSGCDEINQSSLWKSGLEFGQGEIAASRNGEGYMLDASWRRQDYDKAEEGGFGTGMHHGVRKARMFTSDYDKALEGGIGTAMNYGVKRAGVLRTGCYDANEGGLGIGMNHGVKKAGILKPSYDKAEEGGLASGRNYGVKKAGMLESNYDKAEEGGFASGRNYGVKKAGMLESNYDKAEEGGFAFGRNYGVKKAGVRSNEWSEGLRFGIGDGTGFNDGLQRAELRDSNWGRARKRYVMN